MVRSAAESNSVWNLGLMSDTLRTKGKGSGSPPHLRHLVVPHAFAAYTWPGDPRKGSPYLTNLTIDGATSISVQNLILRTI